MFGPQLLARADDLQPHAALEVTRGDAHERDPVAVRRVHVGLDLEDDAAELRLVGRDRALDRDAIARRRRQVDERVEHLADAEVVDRRAEEHRRLPAGEERRFVELGRGVAQQVDVVLGVRVLVAEALGVGRVVDAGEDLVVAAACR